MKKTLCIILILFMLIGFVACDSNAEIKNSDVTGSVTYDETYLPDGAEKYVLSFLDEVYSTMATLQKGNFREFFTDTESDEEYLICQYAMDSLCDIRLNRHTDLKMSGVKYNITVTDVEETSYGYEIHFSESYEGKFSFMDDISKSQGILSIIGLEIVDEGYKIRFYDREEDFYYLYLNRYEKGDGEVRLKEIRTEMQEAFKSQNEIYASWRSTVSKDKKGATSDIGYNRNAALQYALKYALERNEAEWHVYDELGGNCQNFASQVLNAGGIPMDLIGDDVWKYYGWEADNSELGEGRSYSWVEVNYFYEYARDNTGYGLCSGIDKNIYTALPGDVMQMSSRTSSWAHTVVATGTVLDEDGNIIDVITSSNTVDRLNYPISAYNYPYFRLIAIYGYKLV